MVYGVNPLHYTETFLDHPVIAIVILCTIRYDRRV